MSWTVNYRHCSTTITNLLCFQRVSWFIISAAIFVFVMVMCHVSLFHYYSLFILKCPARLTGVKIESHAPADTKYCHIRVNQSVSACGCNRRALHRLRTSSWEYALSRVHYSHSYGFFDICLCLLVSSYKYQGFKGARTSRGCLFCWAPPTHCVACHRRFWWSRRRIHLLDL